MRKTLHGYYPFPENELDPLWKTGLFVVDANVLLNLYQYRQTTRAELLDLLRNVNARLWLPNQAAVEFHERRIAVLSDERESYRLILKEFKRLLESMDTTRGHPFVSQHMSKKLDTLYEELKTDFAPSEKELDSLLKHDTILDEVTNLFDGRVGPPFDEAKLEALVVEGERRYKERIPPGFEDDGKAVPYKYGDFRLWKQILDKGKDTKKGVIFITDDSKKDWWTQKPTPTGPLPLPALRQEFRTVTGTSFYMYRAEIFMRHAGKFLKRKVAEKAIQEVQATPVRVPQNRGDVRDALRFFEEYNKASKAALDALASPAALRYLQEEQKRRDDLIASVSPQYDVGSFGTEEYRRIQDVLRKFGSEPYRM